MPAQSMPPTAPAIRMATTIAGELSRVARRATPVAKTVPRMNWPLGADVLQTLARKHTGEAEPDEEKRRGFDGELGEGPSVLSGARRRTSPDSEGVLCRAHRKRQAPTTTRDGQRQNRRDDRHGTRHASGRASSLIKGALLGRRRCERRSPKHRLEQCRLGLRARDRSSIRPCARSRHPACACAARKTSRGDHHQGVADLEELLELFAHDEDRRARGPQLEEPRRGSARRRPRRHPTSAGRR